MENNFGQRKSEDTMEYYGYLRGKLSFKVRYDFSVNFLVNVLANILFSVSWYLRNMTSMFEKYRHCANLTGFQSGL